MAGTEKGPGRRKVRASRPARAARARTREGQPAREAARAAELAAAIEQLPSGVLVVDTAGRSVISNEAAYHLRGGALDPSRPAGEQVVGAYAARDVQTGRPLAPNETTSARALAGETVHDFEYLFRRPGETEDRLLRSCGKPLRDAAGQITGAAVVFWDVTDERRLARELAASAEQLRALYEAMACGVVVLNEAGEISDANEAALEIIGRRLDEVRGHPLPAVIAHAIGEDGAELPPEKRPGFHVLRTGQRQRAVVMGITPLDGEFRWLQVDAAPIRDQNGQVQRVVLSFIDITERKRFEEQLTHQALHDALTGLPNRTLLHDRLEQALLGATRERTPVALFVMDLDRFKEVNDTLGHHAGDMLLREVAARLQGALRALDTVARLGGDEFAVLLPATDAAGAVQVVHAVQAALARPITLDGQSLTLAASIGIALAPDHGAGAATLLHRADVAMYVAKRAGSGYAVYDGTYDQHSPARLTLEAELRQALAEGGLLLHYQPKVDVGSGRAGRVEALARWPHPTQGMIPPDQFIPLAEQTGLIVPLTRWVLETALQQCQAWQRAGMMLGVAVNLSMRALHDPQLPETVSWLLRRYAVDPDRLTLELTESVLMADPPRAKAVLARLSDLGLHIAIDDFGTGNSSLGYLKQLPVDEVKIDKTFVQSMGQTGTKDSAIVRSIIELGHNLGLAVVAEGVEDHATWERLRAAHCDVAQGYYLSRPLPAAELEQWLAASQWGQGAAG